MDIKKFCRIKLLKDIDDNLKKGTEHLALWTDGIGWKLFTHVGWFHIGNEYIAYVRSGM
jgi:hypothetical protein